MRTLDMHVVTVVAVQGASGSGVCALFSTHASLQMRACIVVRSLAPHACDACATMRACTRGACTTRAPHACDACVKRQMPYPLPAVIVSRGYLYYDTGIANSPCSWCAGHMSPPRLQLGGRRHLLPGHLPNRRAVAGAGVPRCARHACDAYTSPAADAPSRARCLCRADAQSSGEGAARRAYLAKRDSNVQLNTQ